MIPFIVVPPTDVGLRGAPRLGRGAPKAGGLGGPVAAPHLNRSSATALPGCSERWGAWGGRRGPPSKPIERHGFAGALPNVGGLGGPFEAPHVIFGRRRGRDGRARCGSRRAPGPRCSAPG